MAFGRLERTTAAAPAAMSDINMTPLIDVMLVLLVIFIVAAPLMVGSLPLELPQSQAGPAAAAPAVVALAIDEQGLTYLGERRADRDEIVAAARAAARRDAATEVQLRADRRVPYGRVAELIGWVQDAGLGRIALVTDAAPAAAQGQR